MIQSEGDILLAKLHQINFSFIATTSFCYVLLLLLIIFWYILVMIYKQKRGNFS